jgi:hypothetical protein
MLVGVLLAGCASVFDFRREEDFEDSAKRYGRLIRWSDFESAQSYHVPAPNDGKASLPRDVRVTDFEVKRMAYAQGKQQVIQVVEISYYLLKDPRIKKLEDTQVWEFDSVKGVWRLKTGFPKF